jgi:hypothetical protein
MSILTNIDSPTCFVSFLTNVTATQTEPLGKLLIAGGSVNTAVYAGRNYTFGTIPPSFLYLVAAFRTFSNLDAPRVAILRDNDDPICFREDVDRANALYPDVVLYGYYEFDHEHPEYLNDIRIVLEQLKANGVETVFSCSFLDLCIQVCSKET